MNKLLKQYLLLTVAFVSSLSVSFAQDADSGSVAANTTAQAGDAEAAMLSAEQRDSLDQSRDLIRASYADIAGLEERIVGSTGLMRSVLEKRTDDLLVSTIGEAIAFGEKAASLRDEGYDISPYLEDLNWALKTLPPAISQAVERVRSRVKLPDFSIPATVQAAVDEKFFEAVRTYNKVNMALLDTKPLADSFGINVGDIEARARGHIETNTINASVFLDLAIAEVKTVRAGLSVKPADEELLATLKVAESRVSKTAQILDENVAALDKLDIPTTQYKQQLLTATGTLTAAALDFSAISGVVKDWAADVGEIIVARGPSLLFQLFLFSLIVFIFFKLAGFVQRGVDSALDANRQHLSQLLRHMISTISRNVVIVIGVLIALSQFGISLGPLLAGLGIAGFIVGFALQDSLSNFASGMMILLYRPFDVGDTVSVAGASGKVNSMSLVNTTILTFDNQSLIIPNNKIWQDVITNVTDQKMRRIDLELAITYDEDIDRVEKILFDVLNADERIVKDPAPVVKLGSFGDSSVNILCRPWVKTEDYWEVRWDLNKTIKQTFDREGIVIPFPQRDVHLIKADIAE
jgi:small conductance mechanosensitive channel